MKILLNSTGEAVFHVDYESFVLPEEVAEDLNLLEEVIDPYDIDTRSDPNVVEAVKEYRREGGMTTICEVDVPDDATDIQIINNEGNEVVLCVVDGRIVWIYPDD